MCEYEFEKAKRKKHVKEMYGEDAKEKMLPNGVVAFIKDNKDQLYRVIKSSYRKKLFKIEKWDGNQWQEVHYFPHFLKYPSRQRDKTYEEGTMEAQIYLEDILQIAESTEVIYLGEPVSN